MALDKINRALEGLVKEFSDRPLPTREAIAVWGSTQRLSRMEELEEAGRSPAHQPAQRAQVGRCVSRAELCPCQGTSRVESAQPP